MIRRTHSVKVTGTQGTHVYCECSIEPGIGIHLVGLADQTVKESLLRTFTALQSIGYHIPGKKIVINFAPADLRKQGSGYDLPIALLIIAANGEDGGRLDALEDWMVLGELALDAKVRGVAGTLQAITAARESGLAGCIIPEDNAADFAELLDDGFPVYAVSSIQEAIEVIADPSSFETVRDHYLRTQGSPAPEQGAKAAYASAWALTRGNEGARRALEIAAAGGHHLLLAGPDAGTKSALARLLTDLLPPMTKDEAVEVAEVYSCAGRQNRAGERATERPFRAPYYGSSMAALLGGGAGGDILPGEVSLAHRGVLYLDDYCHAPKALTEALRVPLEDGKVTLSRLKSTVGYPARFQFVAGTALCPCGHYGAGAGCTCTPAQRAAFLSKLTGPVIDRIDVQAYVQPMPEGIAQLPDPEPIETVQARVREARKKQQERYAAIGCRTNAEVPADQLGRLVSLDEDCRTLLESLMYRLNLSARAYTRIIRIARTIADLDGSEDIRPANIAEAASYRFLDRRAPETDDDKTKAA